MSTESSSNTLTFYRTIEQSCAYLEHKQSTNILANPEWPMDSHAYGVLLSNGFRRSGRHIYRPDCASCRACVPVRVPVQGFRTSRRQRRTLKANQDIERRIASPSNSEEIQDLYSRYLTARHAESEMTHGDQTDFLQFLTSDWSDTVFIEFRLRNVLVAVAVTDRVPGALSSVYTFFDPDQDKRSLGRLAVLHQLDIATELSLSYLYLGYAIDACQNMAYKSEFGPQQRFLDGIWQAL